MNEEQLKWESVADQHLEAGNIAAANVAWGLADAAEAMGPIEGKSEETKDKGSEYTPCGHMTMWNETDLWGMKYLRAKCPCGWNYREKLSAVGKFGQAVKDDARRMHAALDPSKWGWLLEEAKG